MSCYRVSLRSHSLPERFRVPRTQNKRRKFPLAKHYGFVMIAQLRFITAASLKVDEVDCRSPVERAAATFVPDLRRHWAGG